MYKRDGRVCQIVPITKTFDEKILKTFDSFIFDIQTFDHRNKQKIEPN